jgi:hypothetical protein
MNCFEARPLFIPFWKRTLDGGSRGAFAAHLRNCENCDRSFRAFALTAPVLNSEPLAPKRPARPNLRRLAFRPPASYLRGQVRRWVAVFGASLVLAIGGGIYGALRTTPSQALEEDLSPPESIQDVSYDYSLYAQAQ